MSLLGRNILANFGGQVANTVIALITVPLYLRFLGAEGFGLVSFLLALQGLTVILDFGLSTTANREISRYRAQGRNESERGTLVRTLQVFYYGTGALIFASFAAATSWLSTSWFETTQLEAATLRTAILIAGGSIALRWPVALYYGILRGTERQAVLNLVNVVSALSRGIGTILVLLFVSRSVVGFYWSQLVFAAIELASFIAVTLSRNDGFNGRHGRFNRAVLLDLWRFSVRVGALSLLAASLKQVDKILISNLLPISHLGFYSAASMAANGITKVAYPVQVAVFPRLTHLYEEQDWPALAQTFHRCCQITAFLTVPCAAVLVFFPSDVLWLWTRNEELTIQAGPALSVLASAMTLNSMMSMPFSLQLAAGYTRLQLWTNAIAVLVMIPMMVVLMKTQGLVGAAYAWLAGNLLYYIVVPHFMFRRVLSGHHRTWVLQDTLPPLVSGIVCFGLARWLSGGGTLAVKSMAIVAASLIYALLVLGMNASLRETVIGALALRLARLKKPLGTR